MIGTYDKLALITIEDEKEREHHGGYKYLIQNQWAAHSAFRTEDGLNEWLNITGLTINENKNIYFGAEKLDGKYTVTSFLSKDNSPYFLAKENDSIWTAKDFEKWGNSNGFESCKWLDNGEYTKGFIERKAEGNVIYFLNVNCRDRIVYKYQHK
jgi:hypothetical protein